MKMYVEAIMDEDVYEYLCGYRKRKVTVIKHHQFTEMEKEIANKIWDIAAKSPEHGNALMDLLGEEAYVKIMSLQNKN